MPHRVWCRALRSSISAIAVILLADLQATASAQTKLVCPSGPALNPDSAALRFAPQLHFAPGERFFPTLPFFWAIDRDDNNHSNGADAALDPQEVVPLDAEGKVMHDTISDWYNDLPALKKLSSALVFYRTRNLTESEHQRFWHLIKSDDQLFNRLDDGRLRSNLCAQAMPLMVVEYYFYYAYDRGLKGHAGDVEFVFVFMPTDSITAEEFRVIVGAGHSSRTPNNVLVLHGDDARSQIETNVLVEFGGHASSPDQTPTDAYQKGQDANWHSYNLWGVRDQLATSGRGFVSSYQQWMTFPRVDNHVELRAFSGTRLPQPDSTGVYTGTNRLRMTYDLVPARHLEAVYKAIDAGNQQALITGLAALDGILDNRWDVKSLIDRISADFSGEFKRRLSLWAGPDFRVMSKHQHFVGSPVTIFKGHLYPPTTQLGPGVPVLQISFDQFRPKSSVYGLGWMLPDMDSWLEIQGIVEVYLQYAPRERDNEVWRTRVLFDRHYSEYASIYFEAGYNGLFAKYQGREGFQLGGGVTFVPLLSADESRFNGDIRIRVGLSSPAKLDRLRTSISMEYGSRRNRQPRTIAVATHNN
jgi:hypothetical protein